MEPTVDGHGTATCDAVWSPSAEAECCCRRQRERCVADLKPCANARTPNPASTRARAAPGERISSVCSESAGTRSSSPGTTGAGAKRRRRASPGARSPRAPPLGGAKWKCIPAWVGSRAPALKAHLELDNIHGFGVPRPGVLRRLYANDRLFAAAGIEKGASTASPPPSEAGEGSGDDGDDSASLVSASTEVALADADTEPLGNYGLEGSLVALSAGAAPGRLVTDAVGCPVGLLAGFEPSSGRERLARVRTAACSGRPSPPSRP